jgi:hypothetical protein
MAIGDSYATLEELKSYASVQKDTHDDLLRDALSAASRGIEQVCHRQFNAAAAATARVYRPLHSTLVKVEDFHTTTGLVVKTDTTSDGTFDTTWDAGDFEPRPLNGVVSGQPGWPYYELWSDGTRLFPIERFASIEVTAAWGWATVPTPVKQACLIVAEELFKLKDAPFGVAGMDSYGTVRVRENPLVLKRLAPYIRYPVAVA